MDGAQIRDAWRRIRSWYARNVHEPPYPDFFEWGAPATTVDIDDLEAAITITIPDDMRATYELYNGTGRQWVFDCGYLMSLSEVRDTWKMFKEPVDQGLFDNADADPLGPIKKRWWSPKWIPIVHNGGGDYHCLDVDPACGGTVGQLIGFEHETGPSHVLAKSLRAFLTSFAQDLENGKYAFDPDVGSVKRIS